MLTPFAPLLPRSTEVGYEELARAAKTMRIDPAGYRPVAGIEFEDGPSALWRWEMTDPSGCRVVGLLGIAPLSSLIPHEATTVAALTRPVHPVQIRPVMALIDEALPEMKEIGPTRSFVGTTVHTVVPVAATAFTGTDAVIADGHHRVAAALREGGDPGIMTLVVSTRTSTLQAGSFHRVFAHPARLPSSLPGATIAEEDPLEAVAAGRIAVITPSGSVGIAVSSERDQNPWAGIPAGWVHHEVLPALGLDESDAVYLDDPAAAIAAAHYGTAILLPGSESAAVVTAARSGVLLPPKATRFRPKPLRGFVMRRL